MSDQAVEPSRKEIWKMFDTISSTYDKTNRLMTMGLDRGWRKKMASLLPKLPKIELLDCATGTADQIISLMQKSDSIEKAIGIDLSEEMVEIGRNKLKKHSFNERVELRIASALEIPFDENRFDCVTMSFGIRNVSSVELCLQEILRVLKPGGRVLILETSIPKMRLIKFFHLLYLRKILPRIGGWISKQKTAYQYLNQTTETFPSGKVFCDVMEKAGFCKVICHPLTCGAVSIYQADKPCKK
jgi:demethylmenaquinone methyltransferase/2-methoxy-6-polyprenyl-1,4-benzoquinol methylase